MVTSSSGEIVTFQNPQLVIENEAKALDELFKDHFIFHPSNLYYFTFQSYSFAQILSLPATLSDLVDRIDNATQKSHLLLLSKETNYQLQAVGKKICVRFDSPTALYKIVDTTFKELAATLKKKKKATYPVLRIKLTFQEYRNSLYMDETRLFNKCLSKYFAKNSMQWSTSCKVRLSDRAFIISPEYPGDKIKIRYAPPSPLPYLIAFLGTMTFASWLYKKY